MNNEIVITNRKEIKINDLIKLKSFNTERFDIKTNQGDIIITGFNLEMDNLDTIEGILFIKGDINKIILSEDSKPEKESFIKKLFK